MTKGIEDMLGIPHLDDVMKSEGVDYKSPDELPDEEEDENLPVEKANVDMLKALQERLQTVEGSDHAKAMDEIHRETLEHSRNIMDLAFNVDDRARRGLFEQAANFYKTAMDAKNSKRDAQLKIMRLFLDQQRLELEKQKARKDGDGDATDNSFDVEATIVEDRNVLVQKLREQMKAEEDEKKT